jgi:hypothetical protein
MSNDVLHLTPFRSQGTNRNPGIAHGTFLNKSRIAIVDPDAPVDVLIRSRHAARFELPRSPNISRI